MKLEDKVVSLDLAKRMKELGWDYETERYWVYASNGYQKGHPSHKMIWELRRNRNIMSWSKYIPAPDAIEVGERLPEMLSIKKDGNHILDCYKHNGTWRVIYKSDRGLGALCEEFKDGNEAEARGKMWCYLKEKEGYDENA